MRKIRGRHSGRIYRFLLRLFPFEFQREYGAEMENVFREQRERENGSALWWKTAIGFLRTAPAEHADVFRRDIRHGLRSLAKNPVITLIAIAVLAIGIGASTAIFSAVNMMLIRPLPVPNPEQVIRVTVGSRIGSVEYTQYVEYRDRNHTMSQLAAFQDKQVTVRTDGPPELAVATAVTPPAVSCTMRFTQKTWSFSTCTARSPWAPRMSRPRSKYPTQSRPAVSSASAETLRSVSRPASAAMTRRKPLVRSSIA